MLVGHPGPSALRWALYANEATEPLVCSRRCSRPLEAARADELAYAGTPSGVSRRAAITRIRRCQRRACPGPLSQFLAQQRPAEEYHAQRDEPGQQHEH